jgi:hypothetical protein
VRWEGISTIVLTVVVLLVSFLPDTVIVVSTYFGVKYRTAALRTDRLTYLNIMGNFFIYSLTVPSFREFLKLKMSAILSSLRQTNRRIAPLRRTDPRQPAAPKQNIRDIQDTPI